MARPKILENPKELKLLIESDLYDQLEKLSLQTGMSISKLSRNLLMMGLEDIHLLQKTGLLTICIKWKDYMEKLQEVRETAAELDGSICFT